MTAEFPKEAFTTMYRVRTCSGFTLLEVLLAVVFLALLAMGMTAIHVSGLQSLDEQADRMLLDGKIRSRMEVLIGTDFAALSNGSEPVTVRGTNYTIAWSVVPVDLDGDANPEPTAKKVTVSVTELPDRSLTTIIVDNEGKVGKL
jgi:prepilin-type N-terminal cleavage/methylation domain-containing protein